jgi:hypothetical protein
MSTPDPAGAMTAEEHIRKAERYAASAEDQGDATGYERQLRRSADFQAAQVHATLAQTLKASELLPLMARMAAYLEGLEGPARETAVSGEPRLVRLRKLAAEYRELAANGHPAYGPVASDILAIIGSEEARDA